MLYFHLQHKRNRKTLNWCNQRIRSRFLFSFWRISKRKLKTPSNDCSSQLHNYFRSQKPNFQLFFCSRVWLQMIINSSMKKASAKWNFPGSTAILLVCNITDLYRNYQSHQEQQQTRRNFTARKVHGWRDFTFGLERGNSSVFAWAAVP